MSSYATSISECTQMANREWPWWNSFDNSLREAFWIERWSNLCNFYSVYSHWNSIVSCFQLQVTDPSISNHWKPSTKSRPVMGRAYRVSRKGISCRLTGTCSNLPWQLNFSPLATHTLKGSMGTTGNHKRRAIRSVMKLWVESLSMRATTSNDLILAATLIVLGEDHLVSACCEILGSGSVLSSLSTWYSFVTFCIWRNWFRQVLPITTITALNIYDLQWIYYYN